MYTQKSLLTISLVIILLVIGGGAYYVFQNNNSNIIDNGVDSAEVDTMTTSATSSDTAIPSATIAETKKVGLSNEEFMSAVGVNATKVMARGDINSDGYEDAVVQEIYCGASCSVALQIVFNKNDSQAELFKPAKNKSFYPAYNASGATKSEVTSVTIKNGVISLTGMGLACGFHNIYCQDEEWHMVRTVNYTFDGKDIIQTSVNPPLTAMKVSSGTYEFSEFANTNKDSNQTWVYRVYVKNDSGNSPVTVNVDGFQTMLRIYATGVTSGGSIDVVFDSYAPESMNSLGFKKGDVLFTLTYSNGLTIVHWGKMQPNLDVNKAGAKFVKISNSDALN